VQEVQVKRIEDRRVIAAAPFVITAGALRAKINFDKAAQTPVVEGKIDRFLHRAVLLMSVSDLIPVPILA
jgi:hypothetical protein